MKTDMVSVGREGEKPTYLQSKRKHLKHVIKEHIKEQTTIITATYAQAKYLHETLNLDSQLLDKETLKMDNDLLIMPIYYAKGMEFDHVIYVRDQVHEALQAQVDYTAITRAKHQLTLIDLKDHFAS
jgi:DNA helicase-2/ATP-dependent DNA helicase PcrA